MRCGNRITMRIQTKIQNIASQKNSKNEYLGGKGSVVVKRGAGFQGPGTFESPCGVKSAMRAKAAETEDKGDAPAVREGCGAIMKGKRAEKKNFGVNFCARSCH